MKQDQEASDALVRRDLLEEEALCRAVDVGLDLAKHHVLALLLLGTPKSFFSCFLSFSFILSPGQMRRTGGNLEPGMRTAESA